MKKFIFLFFRKLILIIVIAVLVQFNGCKDKKLNNKYSFGKIDIKNYSSVILFEDSLRFRYLQYEVYLKDHRRPVNSFYHCFKGDAGGLFLQTDSKTSTSLLVMIYNYQDENYKGYFIIWNNKPPSKYREIPDTSTVTTNLKKEEFLYLYPNHKGKYNYVQYDTIKASILLNNVDMIDKISQITFVK